MSGELIVMGDNITRTIFFVDGRLAFATTTSEGERLGELLLAAGKINRLQLEKALEIKKNPSYKNLRIGELLVKLKKLEKRDFYFALKAQVQNIATATFPLKEGEWRFILKSPEIPNPQSFKIKLPEIIPGGVKKIADISFYKKKFYYRAPVTTAVSDPIFDFLTPDEHKLYKDLAGFTNTSVEQIMTNMQVRDNGGPKEQGFWRRLILLYLLNTIDFVEYTIDEEQNKNVEEINDLHERIKQKRLNYYQLLGTKNAAPIEEIKKSYFDYSRKYHPDKINAAPDSTVMMRANEVFAEINKAFEVLSDRDKKSEYDARGYRDASEVEVGPSDKGRNARDLYIKANRLYKVKRYFEAVSLLEQAVAIDNSRANYFLLLGLAQSKLPAMIKHAEKNLLKAQELEPWNADHVFALGELYRSERLMKKAEHYFQKALEINMEHTLAGQAVQDMGKLFAPSKKPKFSLFKKK
ncbi:MAG: DnaJ domain-containing protein [Candidatus Aminicenantes bacterium]|nr:MAG: DnaJ domain-containing protein [Candidatus Aminicenantes bacterium]